MRASIAPATRHAYSAALRVFYRLVPGSSPLCRATTAEVLLFVASLHMRGMVASSIPAKLSAIGFWHQLHHYGNPCDHFLVKKAVLGVANLMVRVPRYRLPVSPSLHLCILHALPSLGLSAFQVALFTAVFTLAFFAFL